MKKIFLVWVGGIADEFDNEAEAKVCESSWIRQGYDDVQIEILELKNEEK